MAWLLLVSCLWLPEAHAQFSRVKVRMQSGEVRPILDLPWFRLQLNVVESQWKSYANTADWVVTSAPQHCPFGSAFRLRWNGPLMASEIALAESSCTDFQRKKYESAPAEVGESCACKPVLRTVQQGTLPWSEALWESLDDQLLMAEELRLALLLKSSQGQPWPVMLVLGSTGSGLFDLNQQMLCVSAETFELKNQGIFGLLRSLMDRFGTALPISCLGQRQGTVDFSGVRYSVLRGRMSGQALLKFNDGEQHELEFP
jgi:hypothetical protein